MSRSRSGIGTVLAEKGMLHQVGIAVSLCNFNFKLVQPCVETISVAKAMLSRHGWGDLCCDAATACRGPVTMILCAAMPPPHCALV
jgi:hypothetical protein